ncbi:MAG: hypothetical protein FWC41_10075 [Firmicutes bacterium]|nr:hypothetical protein [Bacillota bacterium]
MNNEQIGISAEVAVADAFHLDVDTDYRMRGDAKTIDVIKKNVPNVFSSYGVPNPLKHVAEKQNPIDFMLVGEKTLSLKTNKGNLGKVAPENIGQPTAETYFEYFKPFVDGDIPPNYEDKRKLFKQISILKIDEVFKMYWTNLFLCDYYIHFYDVLSGNIKYLVIGKPKVPEIEKSKFSFTQTITTWNESNTVKYNGLTIGEFQAHRNRNCFKFRFSITGLKEVFSL